VTKKRAVPIVFFGLTFSFLTILISFFFPILRQLIQGVPFIAILVLIFFLGSSLIFLVLKQKIKGPLRKFLLLTGIGAVGFFGAAILHNLFYGLGVLVDNIPVLAFLAGFLEVVFFTISVPISPVIFLIGLVGSLIIFFKRKV